MIPTVTLTVANGTIAGKEFIFEQPSIVFVGRAHDCDIRLPDDSDYMLVSRHHCLLDIDPPLISVSDFGSLNGTFVNGVRINGANQSVNVEVPIGDGDELRVGKTVFHVNVAAPAFCMDCGTELGAFELAFPEGEVDEQRCAACREKMAEMEGLEELIAH